MHSNGNKMFVGIKTNERLRDQLDASRNNLKPFFNENNPEFLQLLRIDDNEYIGKAIESGASYESLGNVLKNLKTMLRMICPEYTFSDDAIKFMALTPVPSRTIYQ